MDVILSTRSSHPDYNGDADYATVQITPELAQHAVERIEFLRQLKQQDSNLYKMVYSDNAPDFFRWHEDLMEIADGELNAVEGVVASDGYAMLETAYTVPEAEYVRTENESMVVYDDCITWEAQLKNTSIVITTYRISLELLRGLAIPVND